MLTHRFSFRLFPATVAVAAFLAAGVPMAKGQTAAPALKTGPAVGAKIPAFEAVDQKGSKQTFESLKGPNGLLLVFVRSADW